MAMMKARKPKRRYAEGGQVTGSPLYDALTRVGASQAPAASANIPATPRATIMPGADYVPGMGAEHRYFDQSTANTSPSASAAANAAQQAEAVQAAYNAYNQGGGSGGAGGGAASGDAAGAASSGEGAGAGGSPGDAGGSASGTGGDGGAGSGTGTGAKGGKVHGNGKGIGYAKGGFLKAMPIKKMAKGGVVKSMSSRGDGCATKGKTKGRMV